MSTMIEPEYGLTVFGGPGDCQSFACGGANSCDSQPWYSASSQRYGCNVHLQVTAGGKCVVVETQDAGPASWVESDAGIAILDAGPQVAQYLFGTNSIGWSDIKASPGKYVVQVSTTSAPLGPCGALADASTPETGGGGSDAGGGGGSGGSGGKGGGGSGGKGGEGGSGGKGGSGGAGSSDGGSYAFVQMRDLEQRHAVELANGSSETVPFTWHDAAGVAPPADLWVEAEGHTILQVYSMGTQPFIRAGLEIVPIDASTPYRLVFSRDLEGVTAVVLDASGGQVIRTAPTVVTSASRAIDVVVPAGTWRTAIESDAL
jgi:hypothetical protein